jgi:hypothetical protein
VLILPVSIATTNEYCQIRLCNKIEDNFLMVSLIVYIEKEIVAKFSIDLIIDDFRDLKTR